MPVAFNLFRIEDPHIDTYWPRDHHLKTYAQGLNHFDFLGVPNLHCIIIISVHLTLRGYKWNQMDPIGSIWFHLYTLWVTDTQRSIWFLTINFSGDHLEPPQGPLVVPGPLVENHWLICRRRRFPLSIISPVWVICRMEVHDPMFSVNVFCVCCLRYKCVWIHALRDAHVILSTNRSNWKALGPV